jgi:hypothetical protein
LKVAAGDRRLFNAPFDISGDGFEVSLSVKACGQYAEFCTNRQVARFLELFSKQSQEIGVYL